MSGTLIKEGKYSFYRIEAEIETDGDFELKMITGNQPDYLLKLHINRECGHLVYLDYNVTGLVSLASCEEQSIDYLYTVISGLDAVGDILSEYLLTPDGLLLDPESVFLRKETGQIYFCYVPGARDPFQKSLQGLMEYFMKVSAPAGEQDVLLLYGLYQKSREETVTPGVLAEYWRENRKRAKGGEDLPEIAEPEELYHDEEIFAELGLETPKTVRKAIRGPQPVDRKVAETKREVLPEQKGKQKQAFKADTSLMQKIRLFVKSHLSEILIAAVLIVGAILILLR